MSVIERTACTLTDAVAAAAQSLSSGFAFISMRERFEVGRFENGKITVMRPDGSGDAPQEFTDFDAAYELRIFGKQGDWHWRRNGQSGSLATVKANADGKDTLERHYLLWGKARPSPDHKSWAIVKDPRIKPFWVPVSVTSEKQLKLNAIEQVERGVDGNATIAFEQLTGISEMGSNGHGI
jgi:CRISPR-associated protein (TIGR03984 family)